ncbi:hypothetical protein NL676_003717 [Syzygium grande]|nr:hypothetical protein NL676_003717 [Syzygium grande]
MPSLVALDPRLTSSQQQCNLTLNNKQPLVASSLHVVYLAPALVQSPRRSHLLPVCCRAFPPGHLAPCPLINRPVTVRPLPIALTPYSARALRSPAHHTPGPPGHSPSYAHLPAIIVVFRLLSTSRHRCPYRWQKTPASKVSLPGLDCVVLRGRLATHRPAGPLARYAALFESGPSPTLCLDHFFACTAASVDALAPSSPSHLGHHPSPCPTHSATCHRHGEHT